MKQFHVHLSVRNIDESIGFHPGCGPVQASLQTAAGTVSGCNTAIP